MSTTATRLVLTADDSTLDTPEAVARMAVWYGLRPEQTGLYEDAWYVEHDEVEVDVTDCDDHLPPATDDRVTMVHPRNDGGLDECVAAVSLRVAYRDGDRLIFAYTVELD